MKDREWLLDRLLKMQGELVDAQNTAKDFEEALLHAVEDSERTVVRIEARLAEQQARCDCLADERNRRSAEVMSLTERLEAAEAALARHGVDWA